MNLTRFTRLTMMLVGLLLLFGASQTAMAAHSDIEFGYEAGQDKIGVEFGDEGQVFEGEFPTSTAVLPEVEDFTDDPGFASEPEEGLGVGADDIIAYNILSDLLYWDGTSFAPVPAGATITIDDNAANSLVVSATSGVQLGDPGGLLNIVGQADDEGEIHTHIDFTLSAIAPEGGAYGFKMSLSTDAEVGDSKPFGILFNHGLDEEEFEAGVEALAETLVPEPMSAGLIGLGGAALLMVRRRGQSA